MKDEGLDLMADVSVSNDKPGILYSSFGFDTVGFSKNDGRIQRKIKETLNRCMVETINEFAISDSELKNYSNNIDEDNGSFSLNNSLEELKKKLSENRVNTGDGEYVTLDIHHSHVLLEFAIQFVFKLKKINKENVTSQNGIPEIKIRTALHADVGYQIGKSIQGPVLNNLERILGMGSEGDILLSEYIVAVIKVTSNRYDGFLYYAGVYPKKKGGTEKIWYYYNSRKATRTTTITNTSASKEIQKDEYYSNVPKKRYLFGFVYFLKKGKAKQNVLTINEEIGNRKKPIKEKKPLILYTTKKNKVLAISLIVLSITSVIISLSLFLSKPPQINDKINNLKSDLQNEVYQIYIEHNNKRKIIEKIFQDKYTAYANDKKPTIYQLFDNDFGVKKMVNNDLQKFVSYANTKSIYSWIAEPSSCIIKAYKPYDFNFNNISGTSKPWCKGLKIYDSYLSSAVFASGPKDFANVLVSKIMINNTDGYGVNIGYFGEAVNWNSIIPPLLKYSSNNLLLVDNEGYLAADCIETGCRKLTENPSGNNFSNDTKTIAFHTNFFLDRFYADIADNYYLNTFPPNTHLLNNWKLYIVEPYLLNNYLYNIVLMVLSIIVLSVIVYAYLVPRHWIDDYDEKNIKIKLR